MTLTKKMYDKYKNKMWLLKIGNDKYIWFKTPLYIIKQIERFLFQLIKFPFVVTIFTILTIVQVIFGELILDLLKEISKEFIKIFPAYIKVIEKNNIVVNDATGNINSDKI